MTLYTTIDEIEFAIRSTEANLLQLQKDKAALVESITTPIQTLAIAIHKLTCRHNHTDGCPWFYEVTKDKHNWGEPEHVRYVQKANALVQQTSDEVSHLVKIIQALNAL